MPFSLLIIGALAVICVALVGRMMSQARILRDMSQFQSTSIETAHYPIIVVRSGRVIFANDGFCGLYGVSTSADLVDRAFIDLVTPIERKKVESMIRTDRKAVKVIECTLSTAEFIRVEMVVTPILYNGRLASQLVVHDVTEQHRETARIHQIALTDGLTGLLNRAGFMSALDRHVQAGTDLAIAFIDLDGFKSVNDINGHDAGDELLQAIATKIKESLRDGDLACRLGGDEFVIGFKGMTDAARVVPIVKRLLIGIAQPIRVRGAMVRVSGSIGITLSHVSDVGADDILKRADNAMYAAKRAGKNQYRVELAAGVVEAY